MHSELLFCLCCDVCQQVVKVMENFWNQFLNSLYYVHHRALNSCEPQILNFIWSLRKLRQFPEPLLNMLPQNTVALERHLDL